MKHGEVSGSVYIMSPCCLPARAPGPPAAAPKKAVAAMKSPTDSANLPFFSRAQLATAAAWSPNPHNPPMYFDLPTRAAVAQPEVLAKWAANAPLDFLDKYVSNLRRYRAIPIDVGVQ